MMLKRVSRYIGKIAFKRTVRAARRSAIDGHWADAARLYGKAVSLQPKVSWLRVQYGHALKEAGLLKEASQAYQNALRLDGADEETYYHLIALLQKLGLSVEVDRFSRQVVLLVQSGRSRATETPYILVNRAKAHSYDAASLSQKVTIFADLAAGFPTEEILVEYGHVLKDNGMLAEAESQYRRVLAFSPRNADVFLHLGHALKLQGRVHDAIASYRVAFNLSINDQNSTNRHARSELEALNAEFRSPVEFPASLRGRSYATVVDQLMRTQSWSELADKLLDLLPSEQASDFYEFAAQVLILVGEKQKAYSIMEELSAKEQLSESALLIMASELEADNRLDLAAEYYRQALATTMRYGEAFDALVRLERHQLIFELVERNLFPQKGSHAEDGSVAIPAAGRTPGMLINQELSRAIRSNASKTAERLQADGYHAQARLFKADRDLVPDVQ
jgi:tetratricopeptide (TPR) repeat protein